MLWPQPARRDGRLTHTRADRGAFGLLLVGPGAARVPGQEHIHRDAEVTQVFLVAFERAADSSTFWLTLAAQDIDLDADVEVVGRRPFGGALVVRIGGTGVSRDFDLADEIASALWVSSDTPHPGCVLGGH